MTTTANILVLDNYDSFTYNLVHMLKELAPNATIDVYRNNEIDLEEIDKYEKIVLSPGPGIPDEAGILKKLITTYGATKSIFGVCLGCQAIAEVYGGKIYNLNKVYHGVATQINITDNNDRSFRWLEETIEVGRYHSWVVDKDSLPSDIVVSASDDEDMVMALYHNHHDVRGVQFHPESILTPSGKQIMANFLTK
ncbi:MAG TPA: aminodeoxychorismate/anthranilate synthase component II [Prolixibacteraceae bacterium]|nr:aminodeoxychorismate/anthranilate synthase component II [Prolixibacteraceae bacterium]